MVLTENEIALQNRIAATRLVKELCFLFCIQKLVQRSIIEVPLMKKELHHFRNFISYLKVNCEFKYWIKYQIATDFIS